MAVQAASTESKVTNKAFEMIRSYNKKDLVTANQLTWFEYSSICVYQLFFVLLIVPMIYEGNIRISSITRSSDHD